MKKTWELILNKNNYKDILKKVYSEDILIFPNKENVFETFKHFEINETKVVIIGQDCYINYKKIDNKIYPQANGLAFSVNPQFKIPPSLKNIFKELEETVDTFTYENGDLSRWVKEEKVLLLNTSLTVEYKKSNSHSKYWQKLTDNIIQEISNNCNNIVFILWGNFAKSKRKFIDSNKHFIITGVHPSPLSAKYNKKGQDNSFFGHNYFNKCNDYLIEYNKSPIKW